MKYGIALKRKPYINGLIKEEAVQLFNLLNEEEAFPIEFESGDAECSAIGFITKESASSLDYEYKFSGLREFMETLLLTKEHIDPDVKENNYQFRGIDIHVIWQ